MSLLFADCFDIYGTTSSLLEEGVYAENDGAAVDADPDGVSTQRVLKFTSNDDRSLRKTIDVATDVLGQGARFYIEYLPSDDAMRPYIFTWRDGSNSALARLTIDTTGRLSFYMVESGGSIGTPTLVATTASPVVTANGWWHIAAQLDTASPSFVVQVEGVEKMNETSFTPHASALDTYQVRFEGHDNGVGAGPTMYMKDLVLWDDAGSVNNTFLGSVQCVNMTPDGDDTLTWSVSTGSTSYEILDNNPPLDDSAYIYAGSTPPAANLVTLSNLPVDVSSVKGLVSFVRAKKSDGGDATLQVGFDSAGSVDLGADRAITTAYLYYMDVSELDPDAAAAWTLTTANAAKLQIDRTS